MVNQEGCLGWGRRGTAGDGGRDLRRGPRSRSWSARRPVRQLLRGRSVPYRQFGLHRRLLCGPFVLPGRSAKRLLRPRVATARSPAESASVPARSDADPIPIRSCSDPDSIMFRSRSEAPGCVRRHAVSSDGSPRQCAAHFCAEHSFIPPFSVIIGRIKRQRNGMCHRGGAGELIPPMEVTLEGRYTGRYADAVSHATRSRHVVPPGVSS